MKQVIIIATILVTVLSTNAQTSQPSKWSLQQMITYATEHNLSVNQAQLNQQAAELNLKQAKAALLPSLSGSASQSINKGTSADPITYDFVSNTIHSTSVGLNSQLTLYNGSKTMNTIKQNDLLVNQNKLLLEEAQNSVAINILQAYLQALLYKEGVSIASKDVQTTGEQLKRSEALYDAGSVALKDVADMRSQFAQTQYNLVTAQNSLDNQVLVLKQILELDPEQAFELEMPDTLSYAPDPDNQDKILIYQRAVMAMPEIKASEIQRKVETLDLKIAKAGLQPTLLLNGSLTTGYTSTQEFAFEEQFNNNFNQRLGLTLNIPIFNNYRTRNSVQQAKINIRSAELNLLSEKKELYQKIESAYQKLTAAVSEMNALQVQKDASETSFNLARQQHELGLITTIDLLEGQNNYLAAQQKLSQSKYTAILYQQLLAFYQGHSINI